MTSDQYLHLEVSNTTVDGKSRRVTHLCEDGSAKKIDVFYELDRIIPWSEHTVLDGHVLAILLYAMGLGKPLKIHGALSRVVMRNLEELQLAWCLWNPEIYKKIEIIPDKIDNSRKSRTEERAISAFSGGVDATFTALRHTKVLPDSTRYPLHSVLMVHGFDVDVYNSTAFEQLTKRVQPLMDDLSLDLRTVRTNSRDLKIQDWADSHGLELAACLHMYSDEFEFGLIGSSHSYDALRFPWGSNPVTEPMMSGNSLSIVHDGCGFVRTDKVAVIKDFPVACKTLKVCWAGVDQSGNCGKCEKCVRTQMNFLAAGMNDSLPCFPKKLDVETIMNVKIYIEGHLQDIRDLVDYAKKHNVKGEWINAAETLFATWKATDEAKFAKKKYGGPIKRAVVKIIMSLGLGEPTKKLWRRIRRAALKVIG
jgi:hypothetical protein